MAGDAHWNQEGASFKTISKKLNHLSVMPSELVEPSISNRYGAQVRSVISNSNVKSFGLWVSGTGEYPNQLKDAEYPAGVLYYRGCWDIVYSRCVSVVGTRQPSPEGICRTRKLVKALVEDGFTIVSGLAKSIDQTAHQTSIDENGCTIAIIGTPVHRVYPAEHRTLQEKIAREHLLISPVPVSRWQRQQPRQNHMFFPERNIVMSALTEATIIIEAGEISGTLVQARHALKQGQKL